MRQLCDAFLAWSGRHNKPKTRNLYRWLLDDFCGQAGGVLIRDLRPFHVNRWVDSHPEDAWSVSTRRSAITAVKRACAWAADEGLLDSSPVKRIKRPPVQSRDRIMTPQERTALLGGCRDEFHDYLVGLFETGARPMEVAAVRADHFDADSKCWIVPEHKTAGKTGQPRWIYLTDPVVELCRRLASAHPEGPLFRNAEGHPWSYNALRSRFRRLCKRLGFKGLSLYIARHTFATDALERGVPIASLKDLLGHRDTQMICKHYGHLNQRHDHLRAAVEQARAERQPTI